MQGKWVWGMAISYQSESRIDADYADFADFGNLGVSMGVV